MLDWAFVKQVAPHSTTTDVIQTQVLGIGIAPHMNRYGGSRSGGGQSVQGALGGNVGASQ